MTSALCLHGWGYTRDVFSLLPLNPYFNEIAKPCLYKTASKHGDYSLNALAESLSKNLQQDTVLFGWSLGGLVALNMLEKTDKIKAVILIASTPVFVNRSDWGLSIDENDFNDLKSLLMTRPEQAIKQFNLLTTLGEDKARHSANKAKVFLSDVRHQPILQAWLIELYKADFRNVLSKLKTPTLMFFGERDHLIRLETVNNINNNFIETHVLNRCGHLPFINQSKQMLEITNQFLNKNKNGN